MKKIQFKQNDLKRGIPFATIYLSLVFTVCYVKFGGMLGMADAVDNIGSAKGAGILIGLAVLAPFFIILMLLMPKISVEIFQDKVTITKGKKNPKVMFYNELSRLQVNVTNLNQLEFIGNNNSILCQIQPQNKPEAIGEIISEISKHVELTKQTGSKNYFGKSFETTTYSIKS